MNAQAWRLTFAAALLMGLVMGTRSSFGLFVSPLNTASGMGLSGLSLALALGQLAIGFSQPVVGMLADRFGAARVIVMGAWLLMLTTAVPALWPVPAAVAFSMVAAAVAGSAVGSNGLLVGEVGRAVPAARMGLAVGMVGAGASLGQLVLGPATQALLEQAGWVHALFATALISLVALPLARPFKRPTQHRAPRPMQPVGSVMRDPRFWRVSLSFGVCGFHIGFLAVHMPGVIERCGLPASLAGTWIAVAGAANILGSVAIGLAMKRHDSAHLLVVLYLMRALGVGALLLLPSTPMVLTGFAVLMGASHMATLPPTTQLVARQHGVERLGTLFGVVMLVHQLGAFAGIWLGGWAADRTGSDTPLWLTDIALALLAALLVWPSRLPRQLPSLPSRALAVKA